MTKNRKGGINKYAASQKLVRLVEKACKSRRSINSQVEALKLVRRHIENEQDDVLFQALEDVEPWFGFDWLETAITRCAETKPVLLNRDKIGDENNGSMGEALLFAVPVVLCVEPGVPCPDTLKDAGMDKLFNKYELLGEHQKAGLHNELLQFSDIDLSPSSRQKMLNMLVKAMEFDGPGVVPISLRQSPIKQEIGRRSFALILRFLVGSVVSDLGETAFASMPSESGDHTGMDLLEDWREVVEAELVRQTGLNRISAGNPRPISDAVSDGFFLFHRIGLSLTAQSAVIKTAEKRSECLAIVGLHGDDNDDIDEAELRIAFFDNKRQLVESAIWPILRNSEVEDMFEIAHEIFHDAGVDRVIHMDGYMPSFDKLASDWSKRGGDIVSSSRVLH